jgi:hypothetical protein
VADDAHESRLQRLEADLPELAAAVARQEAQAESLGRRVDEGFDRLQARVEELISPVARELARLTDPEEGLYLRVGRVEEAQQAAAQRRRGRRKAAIGLGIGAAAVAVSEAVKALWLRVVGG